jgi:hypothetical protein
MMRFMSGYLARRHSPRLNQGAMKRCDKKSLIFRLDMFHFVMGQKATTVSLRESATLSTLPGVDFLSQCRLPLCANKPEALL